MTVRAAALLIGVSSLLGGCAGWPGGKPEAPVVEQAKVEPPPIRARVRAPDELRLLLERHLDLVRLPTLSGGDALGEAEWARLIAASPAQVRELLQTEGYFAPEVRIITGDAPPPGQPREVQLEVSPGPQTSVSRVTFEVQGDLQADSERGDGRARAVLDELRKAWPLPPGATFRNAAWSDAKNAALAKLRAAGYANASWSGTAAEIDPNAPRARLFLVADSGPLFRAGEIEIEGLSAHEADTVRAMAAFRTGEPLTEGLLLDYQERLQKSGLFEGVTVTHDLNPDKAANAKVTVKLQEQTLQVYTVGVGYSANTGPRATVEHVHRRLFGWPLRSRADLEVGGQKQALNLELSSHPREGLRRRVFGAAIERLEGSDDVVLSQRARVGLAIDGQRLERLYFVEAERNARTTAAGSSAGSTRSEAIGISGNAHLVFRDLDSVVLPTNGYTLALQTGLGRSHGNTMSAAGLTSDTPSGFFGRGYGRLTLYRPLGSSWYGQARLELGQVFRKTGVPAPESQLWRAGGDDSVRGYPYRDLGPLVGGVITSGAALLTSSIELARPFSTRTPSVWGAVFIDAGRAATSFGELKPAIGAGIGLRWRSPVGPLRVDWAYGEELRRWRLHFSVGIAL